MGTYVGIVACKNLGTLEAGLMYVWELGGVADAPSASIRDKDARRRLQLPVTRTGIGNWKGPSQYHHSLEATAPISQKGTLKVSLDAVLNSFDLVYN